MGTAPDPRPETRRGPGRPGYDAGAVQAAAVALFTERGYDAASMDQLATRLGISKSAIYHHVSGKQELLAAALDQALGALEAVAAQARQSSGPAVARLRDLIAGSVRVLLAQRPAVTLLLRVHGNSAVERAAITRRRAFDRLAADLIAQAQADGDVRPELDPAVTARLIFGMVNSLTEWARPDEGDPDGLAGAVCGVVLDGLAVRAGAGEPAGADRPGGGCLRSLPER